MGTGLWIVVLLGVVVTTYALRLRHARKELLQYERVFSESFHASPVPLALVNLTTYELTEINPSFERLIGWSRDELLGKAPASLGITDQDQQEQLARRVRRNGMIRDHAMTLRGKSGELREVTVALDLVAIDHRPHILTTVIDQTDHKRTAAALASTDQRLRELAETIDDVFWVSTPDRTQMLYVSPAYSKVWGRTVDSLYAEPRSWLDAVLPDDRARIRAPREHHEFRIARPDGTVRWIRAATFPVRDEAGTVLRLAGVARDVTEQRSLEEQLRQAQKMESLGLLAGGIAHDFNNLLAVISSCTGLLSESLGRAHPDHDLLDDIAEAVSRASALTRQLLAFSRKQVSEPVVLDPNVVICDTRKLVQRMLGVDIELVMSLDPELRPVLIDREHLVQVILNLAGNARDAMPTRGTLRVTTRNVGPDVLLEISDTGAGMPPAVLARACEPFFTTKEQGKGTGMGLAVVHGIVDSAGGRLEIDSEPDRGTTLRIFLPAVSGAAPHRQPTADDDARGTERILIVDDDQHVRRATARALRSRGYTVIEANSGRSALALLPSAEIDLLVTDIVMPEMSGRLLAEAARSRFPALKVLFMTGYTDDEVVKDGVASGAVDLIEKPFSLAALAQKVRAVVDADAEAWSPGHHTPARHATGTHLQPQPD